MSAEEHRNSDSSEGSNEDVGLEYEGEDLEEEINIGDGIKPYQFEPVYSSSDEDDEEIAEEPEYQRLTDACW